MPVIDNFCLTCASVTRFERVECADGHGADCPEWLCAGCGAAILVGAWPPVPTQVVIARRGRNRAPQAA